MFVGSGSSVSVLDGATVVVSVPFNEVDMETRCVEDEDDLGCPVRIRRGLDVVVASSVSVSLSEM